MAKVDEFKTKMQVVFGKTEARLASQLKQTQQGLEAQPKLADGDRILRPYGKFYVVKVKE